MPCRGSLGVFPCWATSADDERLFDWQMTHEVGPFWRSVSDRLEKEAPGLMVCLELHPGVTIYTAAGFEALAAHVGRNVGLNMDPSHFWWQGIDPVTVVEALGDRIGFSHGKDTLLFPDRIRKLRRAAPCAASRPRQGALAFRLRRRRPRHRHMGDTVPRPAEGRL